MNLEQTRRRRALAGKLAALFIVLMFAALFEGLVAKLRQPFNEYKVLPGTLEEINGPVPEGAQDLQDLTYSSTSGHLQVSFNETHRGFWLGGSMWRGQLRVSPATPPGTYTLTVSSRHPTGDKPPLLFHIVVYPNNLSLEKSSRSFIRRYLGVSSWALVGLFLALFALALGSVFVLGGKIDKLLAQRGQAEIFKVEKLETGYAIAFGLGTEHGVNSGDQVAVFDPDGNKVGTARIERTSARDAVGFITLTQGIRPGYFVTRNQ